MNVKFPCVVVGFKFNAARWNNGAEPALAKFVDNYKIVLPAGYKSGDVLREGPSTQMAVFALGGGDHLTVSGNQDGGNGAGGDAGGPSSHWYAGLETRAALSFWKLDSAPFQAKHVDPKISALIQAGNFLNGQNPRLVETLESHRTGADPGCAFHFSSIDQAYAWLLDKTIPTGGFVMYALYDQVVIIGVNAINPESPHE